MTKMKQRLTVSIFWVHEKNCSRFSMIRGKLGV